MTRIGLFFCRRRKTARAQPHNAVKKSLDILYEAIPSDYQYMLEPNRFHELENMFKDAFVHVHGLASVDKVSGCSLERIIFHLHYIGQNEH